MWGTIIVAGILVVIIAAILFCMRKDRKMEKEAAEVTAVNVRVAIKSFCMYNERTWTVE